MEEKSPADPPKGAPRTGGGPGWNRPARETFAPGGWMVLIALFSIKNSV